MALTRDGEWRRRQAQFSRPHKIEGMAECSRECDNGPPCLAEDLGLARRNAPQFPSRRRHLHAHVPRVAAIRGDTAKMVGFSAEFPYMQ